MADTLAEFLAAVLAPWRLPARVADAERRIDKAISERQGGVPYRAMHRWPS